MKKILSYFLFLPLASFTQTNDLSLDSAFHRMGVGGYFPGGLEYYQISTLHTGLMNFSGIVTNTGINDLTNCKLHVRVEYLSSELFLDSSLAVNLLAGTSDSLWLDATFNTTSDVGDFIITFWVSSDSIDSNTANDTINLGIESDENKTGRSDKSITGIFPTSAAAGGVGNVIEVLYDDMDICGVWVYLPDTASNIGNILFLSLFKYDIPSDTWLWVEAGNDYTITSGDLGEWTFIESGEDLLFAPGDIILVALGQYGGSTTPVFGVCQNTIYGSVLAFDATSGNVMPAATTKAIALVIDADYGFGGFCFGFLPENTTESLVLSQNTPNPFDHSTIISFEINRNASDCSISVSDINGRKMMNENLGYLEPGAHQFEVGCKLWQSGIYFYTLTAGDESKTMRMMVIR